MGGAASLAQIPEELLAETALRSEPNFQLSARTLSLNSNEVLNSIRRRSFNDPTHGGFARRLSRRDSKLNMRPIHELPANVIELFKRIGLEDVTAKPQAPIPTPLMSIPHPQASPDKKNKKPSAADEETKDDFDETPRTQHRNNVVVEDKTTKLVNHIFECLGALQHLVRANQTEFVSNFDESQSVADMNNKLVGRLLLEMITISGLCADTLKILLSASPDAAAVEDQFGRLPLHVALDRDDPWILLIESLISAYPEALSCRDGSGRLPLHVAVDRQEPSPEVMRLLLKYNPEAASAKRGVGRLPIHYCVFAAKPSVKVLEYLLEAFPEGVSTADVYGKLPLHYAIDKPNPVVGCVKLLLEKYPEGARMKDSHSRLPLTIALEKENKMCFRCIKLLCNAYPESLSERGSNGKLPLAHLLDFTNPPASTVYLLASMNQSAIFDRTKPDKDDSPITIAIQRKKMEATRMMLLTCPTHMPDLLRELNWNNRKIAFLLVKTAAEIIQSENNVDDGVAATGVNLETLSVTSKGPMSTFGSRRGSFGIGNKSNSPPPGSSVSGRNSPPGSSASGRNSPPGSSASGRNSPPPGSSANRRNSPPALAPQNSFNNGSGSNAVLTLHNARKGSRTFIPILSGERRGSRVITADPHNIQKLQGFSPRSFNHDHSLFDGSDANSAFDGEGFDRSEIMNMLYHLHRDNRDVFRLCVCYL